MPILTATNLKLAFGTRVMLDGVNLAVEPGERVGIVGRNGCGKSTLMKILAGLMPADTGEVALTRGARAGYLHQDPKLPKDETLRGAAEAGFAELHRLHAELQQVFEKMATAQDEELDRLMKKQVRLEADVEAAGGYAIDHKIDAVLHGLGFSDAQFAVPVAGLSGGQKGRLALATLLLEAPDVLLLDEPTNHLDLDGRLWLESFLKDEFGGAVLMVSHDRYLLDNVVTRIIEVEQARLIEYPGNYEDFREIRSMRRLTMARAYENQRDRWKKEEAYIRRYRAGQRAKQAQGRLSKLDRDKTANALERPMEVATLRLELPKAERTGDIVVSARGISKSYTNDDGTTKKLFDQFDLVIGRGERWGIIGPNGAGKSTLVRCFLGQTATDEGVARMGANVKLGYYHQTHENVPSEPTVWQYLQQVILREAPGASMSEQAARNLAGAFLFSGDEQERPMGQLSGGERSRAVLAGLLASAKNVLVLDEPTNHLDIPAAERLEEALAPPDEETGEDGFEGNLILISHDRALIDATCEHLIVLDGKGNAEIFHGNYSEWHAREVTKKNAAAAAEQELKQRQEEAAKSRRAAEAARGARTAAPEKAKPAGGAKNPLSRLSDEQIEQRIATIEKRVKAIDAELADPAVWRDPRQCQKLGDEREKLVRELEPLEMEWMGRMGG